MFFVLSAGLSTMRSVIFTHPQLLHSHYIDIFDSISFPSPSVHTTHLPSPDLRYSSHTHKHHPHHNDNDFLLALDPLSFFVSANGHTVDLWNGFVSTTGNMVSLQSFIVYFAGLQNLVCWPLSLRFRWVPLGFLISMIIQMCMSKFSSFLCCIIPLHCKKGFGFFEYFCEPLYPVDLANISPQLTEG